MKIEGYKDYCTVGDLLTFIEKHKLPKDSKILIQRVEDFYFEKNGWETIDKEWDKELVSSYIVAWCPVKYPNDDNLYLDAHY